MIVHPRVGYVLRHIRHNMSPRKLQQLSLASEIKAEQRTAVLKSLRPLRPTASRVAAVYRKHRRASRNVPTPLEAQCFLRCKLRRTPYSRRQDPRSDCAVPIQMRPLPLNKLLKPLDHLGKDFLGIGVPQCAVEEVCLVEE